MTLPEIALTVPVGGPSRPLVVLGHSLGTGPLIWERVVPVLAEHYRVTLLSLPGHDAAPVPTEPFTIEELADAVAAAVKVVRDSGLPNHTDAMFTTIEGEWDEVFDVVRRATEAVAPFGSRVSLVLKADIRPGYTGELDAKVARLDAALARAEDA